MVAASDCPAKAHLIGGRKASKPLMEKKRRARINECLDELKTLMENCYTNHIRKRKLEKADILEMTVKHLRYLHKVQQGVLKCTEYQAGFKSCLNGVNQFLLMTDNSSSRIQLNVLKHLSGHLFPGSATSSSTLDSGTTEHGTSNSAAMRQIRRPVWDTASGQCTANAQPNACISNHRAPQATEMNVAEETKTQLCPGNIPQAIRDPSLLKEFCSITLQNYWRPW